ncbi:MAG: hypothetical protein HND52_20890, partial [Ignavibacteriae bacterium]|nr:hypothetical protein [Ignavibacteriota bacterium]
DMMEPYRVPFVDRWVLAMCHRRQIRPDGFEPAGNGWRLRKGSYGRMLSSWERRNASLRFDERLEADLSALCTRLRDKPRGSRDGEVQATS